MAGGRGRRSWQPREMQMVVEWLTKTHPGDAWLTRVRLGSPTAGAPTPDMTLEERAATSMWRRWADALVILEDRLILIEAAIRPQPGKVAQLELYRRLLPHTPEFERYKDLKVELVLLYAIEDPALVLMARERGIRCVQYSPSWLPDYLEILTARERRGSRIGIP